MFQLVCGIFLLIEGYYLHIFVALLPTLITIKANHSTVDLLLTFLSSMFPLYDDIYETRISVRSSSCYLINGIHFQSIRLLA